MNIIDRQGRGSRGPAASPVRAQPRTIQGPNLPNPYFLDPANGDFRLRPDSPARNLGIQDLPWTKIGPEGAR